MVSATHYPLKAATLGGSESREGKWNAHSKDRGVGGEPPNCSCPALGSNRWSSPLDDLPPHSRAILQWEGQAPSSGPLKHAISFT